MNRDFGIVSRLLPAAVVALWSFAAFSAIRLAVAESSLRRDTPEALRAAVSGNPRDSAAWIELGLMAERAGNAAEAERDLAAAAQVDRQYLPAWTLANSYFRRGDQERFWPWAARAAALSYDDLGPLLELCDRMEPDPAAVLARLGGSPRVERAYLDLLTGRRRFEDAEAVARAILARRDAGDAARLADFTGRLIVARRPAGALEIWNGLEKFSILDPERGASLTNGDFATAPSGVGFDWRWAAREGVRQRWDPSAVSFAFSGSQPEDCALLEQWAPLAARRYRLHFEYRTEGLQPLTGLRWDLVTGDSVAHRSPALAAADHWQAGDWMVGTLGAGLGRVRFVYHREPGTTRAAGAAQLRHVRLEAL